MTKPSYEAMKLMIEILKRRNRELAQENAALRRIIEMNNVKQEKMK